MVVSSTSQLDEIFSACLIAMDSTAAEFGAIGRVDVAAPLYAVSFNISVPLPLQFVSRIKNHCAALPVDQHRINGKSGLASRTLPAISP
jgi:hypothetical protein